MDYHASDSGDIIDQGKLNISDGSVIYGGKGNDTIIFGNANVVGAAGNDTFQFYGTWGAVAYWFSPAGVWVDLARGTAQDGYGGTDTLSGVMHIQGSGFDDVLAGNSGNNSFFGNGGNDTVTGGGGTDVFNYYNAKSTDATVTYDVVADTFTVVKHFANGDYGTDHLTGISQIQFLGELSDSLTLSRDNYAPRDGFLRQAQSLAVTLPAGASMQQIKAGDFNGDGNADWLLTTQAGTGTELAPTYFFAGSGDGHFADATQVLIPGGFLGISGGGRTLVADFNGDGRSDMFQMNFGDDAPPFPGGINSLLLSSQESGTLVDQSATLPQVLDLNHGGSVGDINGDGYPDLLVNTLSSGNQLYLNNGKGLFTLRDDLLPVQNTGRNALNNTQSGIIDVNGDGHADLILGKWDSPTSTPSSVVLLNDGHGNFANGTVIPLPGSGIPNDIVLDIKAIDLNGDKMPDLMLSITNGGERDVFYQTPHIQLLINDGGAKFHDETDARISPALQAGFGKGGWIMSLTDVDMNRDGAGDILVTSASDSIASVLLMNKGDGSFVAGASFQGRTIALDANNDGMTDLVTYYTNNGMPAVDLNVMANGHVYKSSLGSPAVGGSSGGDIVHGSAGSDKFIGAGSDHIDGGAGVDTVVYAGDRAAYTIARTATGYSISSAAGVGNSSTLTNVERIVFPDASVALDLDGSAGQAYRLYQAAFNRAPDLGGVGFHIWTMDTRGLSLDQVAQGFINSAEFASTYGNLNNHDFVTQLYANVLHRTPDTVGLKFHTDFLDAGMMTRSQTLFGFSESSENQDALIGLIGNGFVYTPYTA